MNKQLILSHKYNFPIIFLVISSLFISYFSYAQEYYDEYFNLPHYTENPSFTSPDVAGLGKYVDIPVDKYTGVPEISIPVYEIKLNGFSLPISLSYHASGIKVEEVASWVGLGWSLNAGGVITREVKGIPDDLYEVENLQNENGVFQYCINAGYLYSGETISNYCDGSGALSEQQFWKLSHGGLDGEPDIFYFNFLGNSGKFILNYDGSIHLFKKNNFRITFSKESQGFIDQFIIINGNGVKFTFATVEAPFILHGKKSDDLFKFNYPGNSHITHYITAWYITQIELPNSDGLITFNYENDNISTIKRSRQELRYDSNDDQWHSYFFNDAYYYESLKRLHEIIWNNGSVEFFADSIRQDYDLITNQNITNAAMEAKALTSIQINDDDNNQKQLFRLSHSYFYTPSVDATLPYYLIGYSKRLKLDSIYKVDISGEINGVYSFEYDSTPLPQRFSYEQDYWGYYNANFENGTNPNKTLLPNFYEYPWDGGINDDYNEKYLGPFSIFQRNNYSSVITHDDYADRSPNPEVIQACILKKIIYPTGGYHKFIYEPNEFYLDGQNIIGGGVRIKKLIINDNSNLENNITKEYYYVNKDDPSVSSGKIVYLPQFVKGRRLDPFPQGRHIVYSTSQGGLGSTNGSIVGYKEVTVKELGNGWVYYKYMFPASFGIDTADCTNGENCIYNKTVSERFSQSGINPSVVESNFPFPPNPNYDWNRGQLLEEELYNESDELIKKNSNEYQIHDFDKINSMYVKDLYWECIGTCNYVFKYGIYYYLSAWQTLWKTHETIYDENGDNGITTTTEYIYDNPTHKLVTEKKREKSDGSFDIVKYQYPQDITNYSEVFSTSQIINRLILNNNVNTILKAERFKDAQIIYGGINTYDFYNSDYSIPLPSENYRLIGNTYELKSTIDEYDNSGNPLQVHEENGNFVTYLWGYNYAYPIVKVENATYQEVMTAIGGTYAQLQDKTDAELTNIFNNLRISLSNAFVYSYLYVPLVGMVSETAPNGATTSYEYDSFNRLETVIDQDGNIVKHIDYHYKDE